MGVEFEKMTPSNLAKAATVSQALDNQWLPSQLFSKVFNNKISLNQVDRTKYVLREWNKTLIYSSQTVVARSLFFNNAILINNYVDNRNRKSFIELLNRKAIILYLIAEESPDQRPVYSINEDVHLAWLDTIYDTRVGCVRLSWGNVYDDLRRMSDDFHNYFLEIDIPDRMLHLAESFGILRKDWDAFFVQMGKIGAYVREIGSNGQFITRSHLYTKFINDNDTALGDGIYDSGKLFSSTIKQIVDLKYGTSLPDAIGRSIFIPEGSPRRMALGEFRTNAFLPKTISQGTLDEIIIELTQNTFLNLKNLYSVHFDRLSLEEIVNIRETDEWAGFLSKETSLLVEPVDFGDKAKSMLGAFGKLNHQIASASTNQKPSKIEPNISFLLQIGSYSFRFLFFNNRKKPYVEITPGTVSIGFAPVVLRLIISTLTFTEPSLSIDIYSGVVVNGKDACNEVIGRLQNLASIKIVQTSISRETNISHPRFLEL